MSIIWILDLGELNKKDYTGSSQGVAWITGYLMPRQNAEPLVPLKAFRQASVRDRMELTKPS